MFTIVFLYAWTWLFVIVVAVVAYFYFYFFFIILPSAKAKQQHQHQQQQHSMQLFCLVNSLFGFFFSICLGWIKVKDKNCGQCGNGYEKIHVKCTKQFILFKQLLYIVCGSCVCGLFSQYFFYFVLFFINSFECFNLISVVCLLIVCAYNNKNKIMEKISTIGNDEMHIHMIIAHHTLAVINLTGREDL